MVMLEEVNSNPTARIMDFVSGLASCKSRRMCCQFFPFFASSPASAAAPELELELKKLLVVFKVADRINPSLCLGLNINLSIFSHKVT